MKLRLHTLRCSQCPLRLDEAAAANDTIADGGGAHRASCRGALSQSLDGRALWWRPSAFGGHDVGGCGVSEGTQPNPLLLNGTVTEAHRALPLHV